MFEIQPTLTQAIEAEAENGHIWMSITQLMLCYVKFGELKYGEEPLSDERVQVVFSLLSELDRALTDPSAKERWNITNIIMVRCWEYIKDFLEYIEKLTEDAEASSDGTGVGGMLGSLLSALAGASEEAKGGTEPVDETGSLPPSTSASTKRAATANKAASAKTAEDIKDNGNDTANTVAATGSTTSTGANEKDPSVESAAAGETGEPGNSAGSVFDSGEIGEFLSLPGSGDSGFGMDEPYKKVSHEEGGRIPLTQTDNLYTPTGGDTEYDDGYTGSGYANAAADIDRVLDKMAEKAVTTQLETQRVAELNDLANAIAYGDIHDGVTKVVHRIADVDDAMKERYHDIAGPLLHISKQLQRSVSQQLRDKRRGGKQTGLLMGRRLDAHALPRNDGRIFYKTALPIETPEIAVAVLDDESGSMSSGDRASYARATSIILYGFSRSLDIPVMIYGHSTGYSKDGQTVDLYSYAEFDAVDGDDKYRLMDISARSSNRDGAALRFVAEQLSKRPEEVKMLIIVSDGQPADAGYYGTAAEEDLRGVKAEYVKKGILFVAAAIGEDKANIEMIYGESFLDITDLSKLPVALTNVIKRHIRV